MLLKVYFLSNVGWLTTIDCMAKFSFESVLSSGQLSTNNKRRALFADSMTYDRLSLIIIPPVFSVPSLEDVQEKLWAHRIQKLDKFENIFWFCFYTGRDLPWQCCTGHKTQWNTTTSTMQSWLSIARWCLWLWPRRFVSIPLMTFDCYQFYPAGSQYIFWTWFRQLLQGYERSQAVHTSNRSHRLF